MHITISNHQDFKDLDIVAFSYAFSGAMGDPGSVEIVLADGTVHYANYLDEGFNHDWLFDIIPALRDCKFGIDGDGSVPRGWKHANLGMGNHLVYRQGLHRKFKFRTRKCKSPSDLYLCWIETICNIMTCK